MSSEVTLKRVKVLADSLLDTAQDLRAAVEREDWIAALELVRWAQSPVTSLRRLVTILADEPR